MMKSLADLPASALTARLYEIRKEERALLVEFLQYLNELDRRGTVLELGFPSLFAYCTDQLGMNKAKASRRTTAARLLRRFPVVGEYLADGRLIDPRGKDGPATVENLTLRCQAHNLYAAVKDYGAEHIARAIKRNSRAGEPAAPGWE